MRWLLLSVRMNCLLWISVILYLEMLSRSDLWDRGFLRTLDRIDTKILDRFYHPTEVDLVAEAQEDVAKMQQ